MDTLILFTSYYFAAKAEKALQVGQVEVQLIPTPPALSSSCGLCLLLARQDLPRAAKLLVANRISHSGLYTYEGSNGVCSRIKLDV